MNAREPGAPAPLRPALNLALSLALALAGSLTLNLACALGLLGLTASAAAANPQEAAINGVHQLISEWNTPEARRRLEPLLAQDPTEPSLRFAHGRLLYMEADYTNALRELDAVLAELGAEAPAAIKSLRDEVAQTHETLKDFDEISSPDGRFLVRYQGRDKVLMPYLLEVLKAADDALAQDFAYRPEGRVVVEIYPKTRYLAAVSPLTEEDIETSGTIALCKYNRLMFTSPRALVRGYGWTDTVAHELVHYYVTRRSNNTVPIWLHEGIAKFQETRWRLPPPPPLDPPQEDLLARSFEADKLVTFDEMHPSMAKLPSQEAAALAFAEVHMVIDYLFAQKGYAGINALLDRLRDGAPMDAALTATYGVDLGGLWSRWKVAMKARGFKKHPGLVQTSLKFKRPGQSEDEEPGQDADFDTIGEKRVRDFTHLGELLRARDRPKAALQEYRKAMALGGDGNPMIQNGAAATLVALDQLDEIPELLDRVTRYYPTYLKTWLHLGEAWLKLGQPAKAREAFEQAVGINPFHPRPHQALAALYEAAGDADRAARARQSLELLK